MTTYLDHAATSWPKPPAVLQVLSTWLQRCGASPGRGGYAWAREADAVVARTRALLAQLLHAERPERIAFTLNATDALNAAIKGVVRPGDHVVITQLEHNSVTRPVAALERDGVIRVTRVPVGADGIVDPADIRQALTPRTRLVAVMHASNVLGTLQPITVIGHLVREHGALFLVDAAQTAGCFPIHVGQSCIDLLTFPGHKHLLGPPGTGGLYVGPRAERWMRPWREGGTGVRSEELYQPEELPLRLEAGSPNVLGLVALGAGVEYVLGEGVERIRQHATTCLEALWAPLAADGRYILHGTCDAAHRVAVQSLTLPGVAPQAVGAWLDEYHDIAVRCGLHCAPGAHQAIGTFPDGALRISLGQTTTAHDIDRCVGALQQAAAMWRHDRSASYAIID